MAGQHGGRREGAGRKAGLLWRGTQAVSEASREQVEILARDHGADPRGFLASVMNNKKIDLQTRLGAASVLMPFCYPKLSAQAVVSTRVEAVDPGELIRVINDRLSRIAAPAANGGVVIRQNSAEKSATQPRNDARSASAHIPAHYDASESGS